MFKFIQIPKRKEGLLGKKFRGNFKPSCDEDEQLTVTFNVITEINGIAARLS
jgi:hypothetical protein